MKKNLLNEINNLKCDHKYTDAIFVALKGYNSYKDNCFYNEVVDCYIALGNRKEAIKYLQKMLKTEPNNSYIFQKLAYSYFVLQNFRQALKYYKLLLESAPLSSSYNFNVANMYHFLKDYKNAYKYYDIAVKLNPQNLGALNNLGLVYYENNNWQEAMKIFNQAIKISSIHPEAYHHLGIIYRDYADDLELSILYLKKAILLDPDHLENTYQLALSYLKAGESKKALMSIQKCLEMNPKHLNSIKMLKSLTR